MGPVDRVNLMVDFDADGRTGYNFTVSLGGGISDEVITNENNFNSDWDGNWRHAVAEDEQGWTAELLIPWHIAPMRDGVDGKRTVAINLDRVIGSTGERVAWPAVSCTEPRYLSSFTKVVLPAYSQSLLAITPYVSGVYDNAVSYTHLDVYKRQPAFPAVEIEGSYYWDGGLVSNTPLSQVFDAQPRRDSLVFQVDLWNARGDLPQNLLDVAEREKEIQYSSRTRTITDMQRLGQHYRRLLRELLEEIPEDVRSSNPWCRRAGELACDNRYSLIHLIYLSLIHI